MTSDPIKDLQEAVAALKDGVADTNARVKAIEDQITDTGIFASGGYRDTIADIHASIDAIKDKLSQLQGGPASDASVDALTARIDSATDSANLAFGQQEFIREVLGMADNTHGDVTEQIRDKVQRKLGITPGGGNSGSGGSGSSGSGGSGGPVATTAAVAPPLPPVAQYVKTYDPQSFIHGMWQQLYNGTQQGRTASTKRLTELNKVKYIDTKGPQR